MHVESVISALPGWIGYFLLMLLFFNALFCLVRVRLTIHLLLTGVFPASNEGLILALPLSERSELLARVTPD